MGRKEGELSEPVPHTSGHSASASVGRGRVEGGRLNSSRSFHTAGGTSIALSQYCQLLLDMVPDRTLTACVFKEAQLGFRS